MRAENGTNAEIYLAEAPKHGRSSEVRANGETAESSTIAKNAKAFTYRELATATKNFRSDYLLGEGGFGRVYKGQLENGQVYTGATPRQTFFRHNLTGL